MEFENVNRKTLQNNKMPGFMEDMTKHFAVFLFRFTVYMY